MGLLDDAIREHLELKKARGASDLEIAQQESEALGPARRQPLESELESELGEVPAAEEVPPEPVEAMPLEEDLPPPPVGVPGEVESTQVVEPAERAEIADPETEPETKPGPEIEPGPETEPEPLPEFEPEPDVDPDREPEPALEPSAEIPSAVDDAPPVDEGPPVDDARPADENPLAEDELAPEGPPSDADGREDLLEETPEFLQDTPEHDRLWFEQKPPRDFDLD